MATGGNSNVNVNFRVTGGELDSYMSRMRQRVLEYSREFLRNAEKEGDSAKDQLRSYQAQLSALQRKFATESEIAKLSAQSARDARQAALKQDIGDRMNKIDEDWRSGKITKQQFEAQAGSIDRDEQVQSAAIDEQYKQALQANRDQHSDNVLILNSLRDVVEAIRATSQQELNMMRKGDESLVDAIQDDQDPTALLANRLSSQQFTREQAEAAEREKRRREGENQRGGTFESLMKAFAFEKLGGLISASPNAKNEIDLIKPMMSATGLLIGGLAGNLIDAANIKFFGTGLGNTNFGALGTQLGEKIGEFAGTSIERTFRGRDEVMTSNFRLQALTGMNLGVEKFGPGSLGGRGLAGITADLSAYGADFKAVAELQYKIAQSQANGKGLASGAENALALQQGLGISQEIYLSLTQLLRASQEQNRDVMKLVGGVASAGKNNLFAQDRTFLAEFMEKNFANVQKTLLQTQNEVASGTTFDILKRFDSIGGPFSARDWRSTGLIDTIQGSLVNPGSDNLKALSFMALRQQNPDMSLARLIEEQQKGLGSPAYLKTMLGMVDRLGGDESMKILNTANMLGLGGNLAAARKLYENRDKLMRGEISTQELIGTGDYTEDAIRKRGKEQTSPYAEATAQIENAFIEGAVDGLKVLQSRMITLFGDMMDNLEKYIRDEFNRRMNPQMTPEQSKKNAAKNAKSDPMIKGAFNSKGEAKTDYSYMPGKI